MGRLLRAAAERIRGHPWNSVFTAPCTLAQPEGIPPIGADSKFSESRMVSRTVPVEIVWRRVEAALDVVTSSVNEQHVRSGKLCARLAFNKATCRVVRSEKGFASYVVSVAAPDSQLIGSTQFQVI
jgi:hypothetical protein